MDENIIRLSEENDIEALKKTLCGSKNQKLAELFEDQISKGKGESVAFLRAVVRGSPSSDPDGIKRCLFMYKHAIQLLNEGDLSKKVATELIGFLLMEIDSFPGRALADLADVFLEAIKSGSLRNGNSLQLFPKVLSAIAAKESIPMEADGGGEMAGPEFKSHLLNSLCSSRWDPQCVIHLIPMFRDVLMTSDELKFLIEKILRLLKDLDLQELPPMVYQLLLLSTKGHKHLVLEGVTSYFDHLDNACRKENEEETSELQSIPKDQLHHTEGTVILHISFAVKQDQDLGREFIKYLKANQTSPGNVLTRPFNLALAISVAQIQGFEETIFDFLKSAISKSFKDDERKRKSKWIKDNFPDATQIEEHILETVQGSLFGWDHVTQGLVQLGFTLMDAFGPKVFDAACSSTLSPKQQSCKLGARILLDTFKAHEFVRAETLQQILNRVITMATTPVSHYIDLLSSMVSSAPHVLRDCLPKVKEALDHLSFLPLSSARGLLKAIQPLLKISPSLRDSLMLILRKALFSRQGGARQIAVTGFLQILKDFKVLGSSMSSSQPCSQPSSQPLSQSSQVLVDCHVKSSSVGTEGLCLEILGNLRRCLTQQGDVRMLLYEGLYEVMCRNPRLRQPILHLLFTQFQKYYETDDDLTPPVKLEPCLTATGEQIFLSEPLGHLLFYLQHCTVTCAESHNPDEEDRGGESVEHTLNELEDMLQSLVRRMIKSELEDFELDKSADFSLNNSVGIKNNIFARLVSGMYEVLLEYSFTEGEFSNESTDDVLRLYKNYHTLSDILKEKTGAAAKRGRSSSGKQEPHSFFSLASIVSLLKSLFNDTIPSHQESLTALRGSADFVRYVLNGALQKLREINECGVCSGPGGSNTDSVFKQCCSMARVLLKQVSGETCYQEDQNKKTKGKKIISLCLEGYCVAVNIICCRFPQKLIHFLETVDRPRDSTAGQTDSMNEQERVHSHIKTFQLLIASAISSSDEDNVVTLKDVQSLVHLISLLSQHLDPSEQQFSQVHMWVHRICTDQNIDDVSLTKAMVSLLFALTLQCKSSGTIVREIAQDIHSQLGDIDEEIEVEDKTHFAIINPRTAAPTIALLLMSHIETILEELEWTVARLKGELAASASQSNAKLPDSPESTQRDSLEHAVCQRFTALVIAFHELSQSAVPVGPCSETVVKVLNKLYVTLGSLTKYYLTLYNQKMGHLPAKFEKLVKLSGTHLPQQVYAMITYIQAAQAQSLHELSTVVKGKGKKKGAATKGFNPVGKARVMKEMRSIPNLIYSIEQYERYLIQLSKKCKINLMEHFKRSTARDFRINGATLEAALREGSSDEEEEAQGSESESEEPPKKKGKRVEPKGKKGQLSLKHKTPSQQPVSQASK